MNPLSRNKILLTIIAVLFLSNIVMLIMFFRVKQQMEDAKPKKLGFTEKLKTDVGFTPQQMSLYEPKRDRFWESVRKQFDSIKNTKVEFYHYMYDPSVPDSVLDAEADAIGKQQKNLDLFVVRHFKDIRKMCTPEQLPKYDSLLPPLIERMTARPGRK